MASGWAYRLWSQLQRLESQCRVEITQVELAGLVLELVAWGNSALRFVDASPSGVLAAAHALLQRLGAFIASGGITALGWRMLALGMHPRLAAMLVQAGDALRVVLACDLAALLEACDPLCQGGDGLAACWRALAAFCHGRSAADANRGGLAAIDSVVKQWCRWLRCDSAPLSSVEVHAFGELLLHAFSDRIAARHSVDG